MPPPRGRVSPAPLQDGDNGVGAVAEARAARAAFPQRLDGALADRHAGVLSAGRARARLSRLAELALRLTGRTGSARAVASAASAPRVPPFLDDAPGDQVKRGSTRGPRHGGAAQGRATPHIAPPGWPPPARRSSPRPGRGPRLCAWPAAPPPPREPTRRRPGAGRDGEVERGASMQAAATFEGQSCLCRTKSVERSSHVQPPRLGLSPRAGGAPGAPSRRRAAPRARPAPACRPRQPRRCT
jgi:hypothetical protein